MIRALSEARHRDAVMPVRVESSRDGAERYSASGAKERWLEFLPLEHATLPPPLDFGREQEEFLVYRARVPGRPIREGRVPRDRGGRAPSVVGGQKRTPAAVAPPDPRVPARRWRRSRHGLGARRIPGPALFPRAADRASPRAGAVRSPPLDGRGLPARGVLDFERAAYLPGPRLARLRRRAGAHARIRRRVLPLLGPPSPAGKGPRASQQPRGTDFFRGGIRSLAGRRPRVERAGRRRAGRPRAAGEARERIPGPVRSLDRRRRRAMGLAFAHRLRDRRARARA